MKKETIPEMQKQLAPCWRERDRSHRDEEKGCAAGDGQQNGWVEMEEEEMVEHVGDVAKWATHMQIAQTEMVGGDKGHCACIAVSSLTEMRCVGNCQRMQH